MFASLMTVAVTSDVTATAGMDYTSLRRTIVHTEVRGTVREDLEIDILNDDAIEGTEQFRLDIVHLNLDGSRGTCPTAGACEVLIDIIDDDCKF